MSEDKSYLEKTPAEYTPADWEHFWQVHPANYNNEANLRPGYYNVKKHAKYLKKLLLFKQRDFVLDVGCGNGNMAQELRKYSKNIFGVDRSAKMVELASELRVGQFQVAQPSALPFPDSYFDKVVCLAVLQYAPSFEEGQTWVREMVRVCKKGGMVLVGDIINLEKTKWELKVGTMAFLPKQLSGGHHCVQEDSFYEPEQRFDLIITK